MHAQYVNGNELKYSCNKKILIIGLDAPICEEECLSALSACLLCHYSVQALCLSTFLRGGAIPHYVWVSSTVNCQPFVCLSIHLIANNHYPVFSSWQMIDVVLKSDGWPCHSDVQACIKNHLYEMPVSLMKQRTQNHKRVRVLTEECMCTDKGENEHSEGKLWFNSTLKKKLISLY